MKNTAIVVFTVLSSFLSVFGIILLGKIFGVSPQELHDGNLLFSPSVIVTTLLILIIPMLPVLLVATAYQKIPLTQLGFCSLRVKEFIQYLIFGALLELAATGIAIVLSKDSQLSWAISSTSFLTWLLYYAWFIFLMSLNSLNEELIYRSYPISSLCKTGIKPIYAILFSATLFSLVHFLAEGPSLSSFFYRLSFGFLVGIIYFRKQNIWPVVALHTGLNIVANGFSDSTWMTGTLITTTNVSSQASHWSNFVALTGCFLVYWLIPPKRTS